jgi:D-alanine-D-alanine ligase
MRLQNLALKVFKSMNCEGLARVDFFVNEKGDIKVNELNTLPGFTKISMYPMMWGASGLGYTPLITRLIELAMEKFRKDRSLKTSFLKL